MSDDLRSTIEAAASSTPTETSSASVSPSPAPVQADSSPAQSSSAPDAPASDPYASAPADKSAPAADKVRPDAPPSIEEVAGKDKPAATDDVPGETAEQKEARTRVDRAPQSWKGDAKRLWEQLPLQVRQEVARREKDIQVKMQESAHDRQRVQEMVEVMTPHRDRILSAYGNPVKAVDSLLRTEAILHGGTQQQKAQMVAQIIQNFGIDINTLDSVLAGQPVPEQVAQQSNIEALLQQKLAPLQQFIQQQQIREGQQQQKVQYEAVATVQSMAADTEAFPYFNEVREDMADIIEMNARRGVAISLQDAYSRAIRMNDETFRASSVREQHQGSQQAALEAHRAAQAAKGASLSVSGSPAANGRQQFNGSSDLRGTIAAAFDGGRL